MPKTISGFELIKFLTKRGFVVYSQKGSHVKLVSMERKTKTIVPLHKTISKGTLHDIFKQAKLSEQEIHEILGD